MKAVLTAVFAVALLAGCSSDPTAKDFERFALKYAEDATKPVSDNGFRKVTLVRHNLRKTDSLTSPFVGEAEFLVEMSGLTVRHPEIDGYEAKGACNNDVTLRFGWVNGEWEHYGGESKITDAALEADDAAKNPVIDTLFNPDGAPRKVSPEQSLEGKITSVSGWFTITMEILERDHLSLTRAGATLRESLADFFAIQKLHKERGDVETLREMAKSLRSKLEAAGLKNFAESTRSTAKDLLVFTDMYLELDDSDFYEAGDATIGVSFEKLANDFK